MINLVFVSVVRFACSFGGSTPAAEAACVRLCPSKYRWAHYRQNIALRPPLFAKSPQTSTIGSDENLNACSKGRQRRSPVGLTLVSPTGERPRATKQGRPRSPPTGAKRQRPPTTSAQPAPFPLACRQQWRRDGNGRISRRLLSSEQVLLRIRDSNNAQFRAYL